MIIRLLTFGLATFALLRLTLWAVYRDYFVAADVWWAMWQGARFDMRLLVLAWAPFLLVLMLPFWKLNSLRMRKYSAWSSLLILLILSALAIANIAYFGEVKRHLGSEILNIGTDFGFIVQTALGARWAYTVGGVLLLAGMVLLCKKYLINHANVVSGSLKKRATFSILQLLLLVLMARGMVLSGKPLNTVDAFHQEGNQAQANLALNGVWITLNDIRKRQNHQPLHYLNASDDEKFSQQNPQAFHYQSAQKPSGKNVVFILLESWSYRYIDGLAGGKYRVTPYTDELIQKSQVWTQFYAAGQRSILGIQAALTSVPTLPEREPLGFGLERSNMSKIAELAAANGYRTLMAQTSKRRSFHMDGIANSLGFQEYYGQEDIPLIRDYPQGMPIFGWDYDTLQFVGQQINKQPEKPFFAFVFTGTTHEPFANAGAEFTPYPHDEKGENGFLNTLAYSDWALREFMNHAEKQNWYKNTIFVFTADHTLNKNTQDIDIKEKFHIPLIVFDPNNPVPQRHDRLASQYDLLPTFADILGINQSVATFGNSLFAPDKHLPIVLHHGDTSVAILPDGSTAEFQGQNTLSGSLKSPTAQLLLWRMQKADELLRKNQWVK